jgi:hypothetical protein
MNTQPSQDVLDKAVESFNAFCSRNPDFYPCDANAQLLANAVKRLGLDFSEVSSLQHAWVTIKPKSAPARKPAPVPTAAPASEPLELAIEKEANRILASGELEDALLNLSAKQFEQKSYNLAFARALELREQRRAKDIQLARGDVIQAEQRAAQQGTTVASEIAASEKRMVAAQNPNQYSPSAARRSGIVSTHDMGTSSTRRKPTLEAALAQERKDQAFLDAANAKTARLIRVKANKGK